MSDEIRVNRQPAQQPMREGGMQEAAPKTSAMPWIILAVVVVVIGILAVAFRGQIMSKGGQPMMMQTQVGSGYQAVFLTNGQVYFGRISGPDDNYVTLKDIYYLQVVQQPPLQGTPQAGQQQAQPQQSISLVKLGNELHGPVDEMHISRTQVLFYEDLKSDGQVVKAIEAYKANPTGTPAK